MPLLKYCDSPKIVVDSTKIEKVLVELFCFINMVIYALFTLFNQFNQDYSNIYIGDECLIVCKCCVTCLHRDTTTQK